MPPADDAIVYTATYVEVVPPSTAQGAALLRQYREASRNDRDNRRIEVLQRIDRPNQFTVLAIVRRIRKRLKPTPPRRPGSFVPSSCHSSPARTTSDCTPASSSAPRRR